MGTISVPGLPANWRVPCAVFSLAFGQGDRGGSQTDYCLLIGQRAYDVTGLVAQGTATDAVPYSVSSSEEAAGYWGYGSDPHRLARVWFDCYPGSSVCGIVAAKGAGTRATISLEFGAGTATAASTLTMQIAGETLEMSVAAAAVVDDVGTALAALINSDTGLPVIATYTPGTNVLDITCKMFGLQGNATTYEITLPAGMTLAVGAASGVLATGTVEPAWSAAFAAADAIGRKFYHVVIADDGQTAAKAAVKDFIQDGLSPLLGRLTDCWWGSCAATLATAQTLNAALDDGTTAYDEQAYWNRLVFAKASPTEPWVAACNAGGLAALHEASDPSDNWIGREPPVLDWVTAPSSASSYISANDTNEAIRSGICPVNYDAEGYAHLVTLVASKHQIGSVTNPNYVEHTNVTAVARHVSYDINSRIGSGYSGYKFIADVDGEPPTKLPRKTATPSLVKRSLTTWMRAHEEAGYVQNVSAHEAETVVEIDGSTLRYELPIDGVRWNDILAGFHREVGRS